MDRAARFGITVLLAFLILDVALSVQRRNPFPFDPPGWWALLPFLQILITAWCFFDGRARLRPIPPIGLFGLLAFTPIGLPIYLYWSRSKRN